MGNHDYDTPQILSIKKHFGLPTPLRQFNDRNPIKMLRTPMQDWSGRQLSVQSKTPAELRWPLVSYLMSKRYAESVTREARRVTNGLSQQRILSQLLTLEDAIEDACITSRDLSVVSELRNQYALSVIQCPAGNEATDALRDCLLQTLLSLDGGGGENKEVESEAQPVCMHMTLSDEEDTLPSTEVISQSPLKVTETEPTLALTDELTPNTSSASLAPGNTPLDRLRSAVVNRLRITLLQSMVAHEITPLRIESQKRLSVALNSSLREKKTPNEKRSRKEEVEMVSASKRRRGSVDSQAATTLPDSNSSFLVVPSSLESASAGSAEPKTCERPTEGDEEFKPKKPAARKTVGSSMLLGVKTKQTGRRYQSRTAITSKAKQTKERRLQREAARDALERTSDVDDDVEEKISNETKWSRRRRFQLKAMESKYVSTSSMKSSVPDALTRMRATHDAKQMLRDKINDDWAALLRTFFGLDKFRKYQEGGIKALLDETDSRDLFLAYPTGSGKSLVFQFASVFLALKERMTIVICPTLTLLNDQYARFQYCNERCGSPMNVGIIHSEIDWEVVKAILQGLAEGLMDILYVTPEQFVSSRLLQLTKSVGLIVLDEAHCLSEWGHSFRPAYQAVLRVADLYFKDTKLLFLTATVTPATIRSVTAGRDIVVMRSSNSEVARSDLRLAISVGSEDHHGAFLKAVDLANRQHPSGCILIFAWKKYQVEVLSNLVKSKYPADTCVYFHSGLESGEKKRIERGLRTGKLRWLVATQGLGLGIDYNGIATVIHNSLPGSLEQYVQEVGRCNRDQRKDSVVCTAILDTSDYRERYQQIAGSVVDRTSILSTLNGLLISGYRNLDPTKNRVYETRYQAEPKKKSLLKVIELKDLVQNSKERKSLYKFPAVTIPASHEIYNCLMDRSHSPNGKGEQAKLRASAGLVLIDNDKLGRLFNVRSSDELSVILAIMRNISAGLPDIHLEKEDGRQFRVKPLRIWDSYKPGLELRFYGEALSSLRKEFPLIERISPYMKIPPSSAVARLHYLDMMIDHHQDDDDEVKGGCYRIQDWEDIDNLQSSLSLIASECKISVKPLTNCCDKICMTYVRPLDGSRSPWASWIKSIGSGVITILERNNKVQLNRLNALYVGMTLGVRESSLMLEYIEKYFGGDIDAEFEQSPSAIKRNDHAHILASGFPSLKSTSETELASLRHDIRMVIQALEAESCAEFKSGPADVGDADLLIEQLITPVTIARILCGLRSITHDRQTISKKLLHSLWGRYKDIKFTTIVTQCATIGSS